MTKKKLIELLTAMRNSFGKKNEVAYFTMNIVLQVLTDDAYAEKMMGYYLKKEEK